VALSTPTSGQELIYNGTTSKWVNLAGANSTQEPFQALIYQGDLSIADNVVKPGIFMLSATTLVSARLDVGTAPVGSPVGVTIRQGANVLSHGVIAAGATTSGLISAINASVVTGTPITFDITAIGSSTTGADLSLLLLFDSGVNGSVQPYINDQWVGGSGDATTWTITDTFTTNGGSLTSSAGKATFVLPSGTGGRYSMQMSNSRTMVPATYDILFSLDWTGTPSNILPGSYTGNVGATNPASDVSILTEYEFTSGGTVTNYLDIRSDGGARLRHYAFGNPHNVTGGDTARTASFTPGSKIWVRYRHNGVYDLRYRLWQDGSAEPGTWNESYVPTYPYGSNLPTTMPGQIYFNISVVVATWNLVVSAVQFIPENGS
jgi:hypothetical protein